MTDETASGQKIELIRVGSKYNVYLNGRLVKSFDTEEEAEQLFYLLKENN